MSNTSYICLCSCVSFTIRMTFRSDLYSHFSAPITSTMRPSPPMTGVLLPALIGTFLGVLFLVVFTIIIVFVVSAECMVFLLWPLCFRLITHFGPSLFYTRTFQPKPIHGYSRSPSMGTAEAHPWVQQKPIHGYSRSPSMGTAEAPPEV